MASGITIRDGHAGEVASVFAMAGMPEAERAVRDGLADDESCWVAELDGIGVGAVLGRRANPILDQDEWAKAALGFVPRCPAGLPR